MIDRTLLTEALGHAEHWLSLHTDTEKQVMAEAARLLLDFATDQQVEAFWMAINGQLTVGDVQIGLVAVRDIMIGERS